MFLDIVRQVSYYCGILAVLLLAWRIVSTIGQVDLLSKGLGAVLGITLAFSTYASWRYHTHGINVGGDVTLLLLLTRLSAIAVCLLWNRLAKPRYNGCHDCTH